LVVVKKLVRPLPIPSPVAANRIRHRKGELPAAEFAIGKAALILFPSRFVGELAEVLRADVMMLADNHPSKAG
jgi:hypothetical protein